MELEFHDVNEEYEEAKRVNKITEMAYIASTKQMSFASDERQDSSFNDPVTMEPQHETNETHSNNYPFSYRKDYEENQQKMGEGLNVIKINDETNDNQL